MYDELIEICKNISSINNENQEAINQEINESINIDIYIKNYIESSNDNIIYKLYNSINYNNNIFIDELLYNIDGEYKLVKSTEIIKKLIQCDTNNLVKPYFEKYIKEIDESSYIVDIPNIQHIIFELIKYIKNLN